MKTDETTRRFPPNEERLTLSEAADLEGVHRDTVKTWMNPGIFGVKLRTAKAGGRRITTIDWIDEFHLALNGGEI